MVSLSSLNTSNTGLNQNREYSPVRDDAATRERLATTRPSGTVVTKTDTDSQKNYRQQQDFVDSRLPDPSTLQGGNRRGSLLDLTV